MKNHKVIFIAALLAGCIPFARVQGQINDPMAGQGDKEVTQERLREEIPESKKPELTLPANQVKVETEGLEMETKEVQVQTEYTPPVPRAPQPEKPVFPKLYNNYLKVGYGRFATPFARLYLNNDRNDNADIGLDFTHISSHKGYVDYSEFRKDYGTLKASYFLKEQTIYTKLYAYNTNFFYFADTIVSDRPDLKDTIRQNYTQIMFEAGLLRHRSETGLNYDVGLRFMDYLDRYKNNDLHITLLPSFDWAVTKDFHAAISSNLTFSNARFDSLTQSRIFFDLTPTVVYNKGNFKAEGGLKINSYSDSSSVFGAYPILKAQYQLLPGNLQVFAGYQGEMHYNQYYNLVNQNQYLDRVGNIKPSRERMNIYLGASGGFAKHFTFSVKAYHRLVKDQIMFYNPENEAYFHLVYDSTFSEQGLDLNLGFNMNDKIRAGVRGLFRSFHTSNQAAYFGESPLRFDLWGTYNFANKITVGTEVFVYGKRTMSVDALGGFITQDPQADVNLSVDYRFNKRISLFLELNNILNNTYYRWYNYQQRPFDVKGGVSLAF
ncbi:MAG: TonB-dependent receptor [Bacteroidia bacterium]|nr:TonB-dependent receptor [Bacteroidia bacterium]